MHISSLPSSRGMGSLGKPAFDFADFLEAAGQHYWQILPIGPTGFGNSPYQSISTYAGSPLYIDLDLLAEEGLLTKEELDAVDWNGGDRVDYDFQAEVRTDLLHKAYVRGRDTYAREIRAFRRENPWVDDYGLFMAIKGSRRGEPWNRWPEEIRFRRRGAADTYATVNAEEMNYYIFTQFLFFRQWKNLRAYLKEKGIELIGDLPIYVPYDSCDVWTNPDLFQLDEEGLPVAVAGCPPDGFTADGQLWGNPLYDWDKMKEDNYAWWQKRISAAGELFDVIRIDHFRGLESYWSVPYGEKTARNGKWVKGPDHDFIRCLRKQFPKLKLIAEDLGFLTPAVLALRKDSGFPGMKVLEFAFDSGEPGDYLPHRYDRNCICYTGTHDNETLLQWLGNLTPRARQYMEDYLGVEPEPADSYERRAAAAVLRAGMGSVSDTFIAQMQDYLGLGAEARMNEPGTLSSANWTWRLQDGLLTEELAEKIRDFTARYERI